MKKENNSTKKNNAADVTKMIDQLVANAQQALAEYMKMDQEQVDKVVHSMTLAGLDQHMYLAKTAVEETKRGLFEDKVIKNIFATEYIYHSIANQKTVGVIEENDLEGYVEVAEPVGVVAGITPVTNPTSTTMFKALICAKTRNPIIFAFHPSAQKCSAEAARILKEAAVENGAPGALHSVDRTSLHGSHISADESPGSIPDSGNRRSRNGQISIQLRKACPGRGSGQCSLLYQ